MNAELEKRTWGLEVDAEAAKLIQQGVPAYEALKQAVQIVSNKRSESIDLPGEEDPVPASGKTRGLSD